MKLLERIKLAIWCRYRASRLFYVGARVEGVGRILAFALATFEAVRLNPYITINVTFKDKPSNADVTGAAPNGKETKR